jgi:hypothetical protein
MKSTEHFKNTIKAYLDKTAAEDAHFAAAYTKPNRNMDDCIVYILHTVQKSGCNGFTDDEIYSMALHYFQEDSIETGKPTDCKVIINHTVELTAEEKEEARKEAMKKATEKAYSRMTQPKSSRCRKTEVNRNIPSLFNF